MIYQHNTRTFTIGRLGSFSANDLIGELFGRTYEVAEKHLKLLPHPSVQEVGRFSLSPQFPEP